VAVAGEGQLLVLFHRADQAAVLLQMAQWQLADLVHQVREMMAVATVV
jgi:hypothetical protein